MLPDRRLQHRDCLPHRVAQPLGSTEPWPLIFAPPPQAAFPLACSGYS